MGLTLSRGRDERGSDDQVTAKAAGDSQAQQVTWIAPNNIAVIKYWGKRDIGLNLPINSSVSCTLDTADLRAKTTVTLAQHLTEDRLWLNGTEESVSKNKRILAVLRLVREIAKEQGGAAASCADWKAHIVSANSFPTAAGLASSAAGYACLTAAIADAHGLVSESRARGLVDGVGKPTGSEDPAQTALWERLTAVARQGSGSASRSLYGGFVRWSMGEKEDGSDSMAQQVCPASHWPEMRVVVLVVSDKKKETGSTAGMQRSVLTSPLLAHRASKVVPDRLKDLEAAYDARDFETFAKLTMQDSNQFHATCLDTYPPVFYMNDVSRRVVAAVHKLNEACGRAVAAYTFDAGPNAVLYTLDKDVPTVLAAMLSRFPPAKGVGLKEFVSKPEAAEAALAQATELVPREAMPAPGAEERGAVSYVYLTGVGGGPQRLPAESKAALADAVGMPKAGRACLDAGVGEAGAGAGGKKELGDGGKAGRVLMATVGGLALLSALVGGF